MRGYRFYLEYESPQHKRRGEHEGNVFAMLLPYEDARGRPFASAFKSGGVYCYEGLGAVYFHPNSPVASDSISCERLRTHCKRIPESKAREIHPLLFERLDDTNDKEEGG